MDQCASILLAFPSQSDLADNAAYHKAVTAHIQRLSKLLKERSQDLVVHSAPLLDALDPAVHSLSYLAVLHALIFPSPASSVPQVYIMEKVVTCMLNFDGVQCRYAGTILTDILESVGNGRLLPPSVAVEALAAAILRLDPSGSMLTSSHLLLIKLAYETDNIAQALPVIDKDIVFYPGMANHDNVQFLCNPELSPPSYISKGTGLTDLLKTPALLEYDLLRGMMYSARREWPKAQAAFERVVAFPTKDGGCSKITVEAFKKWVLVSLLSEGRHVEDLPYAYAHTIKTLKTLGRPYISIAIAFATDDVQTLKQEVEQNTQMWLEDGNMGLVQEVVAAYQKWRILSLRDIYTQLSIAEIRRQTKSAETGAALNTDEDVEALIQNMIVSGMLKGVIEKNDDGTKFLNFFSPTTHLSEEEFAEETQRAVLRLKELNKMIHATNQRLGTSKEYVRWAVRESRRDKSNVEGHADTTLEMIDDEDLMGSNG